MRRYAPMKQGTGTVWPSEVRVHVSSHQPGCLGPVAGMPGPCGGSVELDHIRASGAIGKKSKSIAVNGARLCGLHHRTKTEAGKTWRPVLLRLVSLLHGDCADCRAENLREYGVPLEAEHAHVDPVYGCRDCPVTVPPL